MFDPLKAKAICDRIAEGESLRKSAAEEGIKVPTFLLWCNGDSDLADQYARAMSMRADVKFEELEDVSDEAAAAESAVKVAGLRLKSDNLKWALSKLAPKKYGDVSNVNLSGSVSVRPVAWEVIDPAASASSGS